MQFRDRDLEAELAEYESHFSKQEETPHDMIVTVNVYLSVEAFDREDAKDKAREIIYNALRRDTDDCDVIKYAFD